MASLISTILSVGPNSSPEQTRAIQRRAADIYSRIAALPNNSTETESPTRTPAAHHASATDTPEPHSLLPSYPEYEPTPRSSSSPSSLSSSPPPPSRAAPSASPSGAPEPPDPVYPPVRLASLLYLRAVAARRPLSRGCGAADALAVLGASWRVPLARWRGLAGVLVFVMAGVTAAAHARAGEPGGAISPRTHTRFAKSILQVGWMQMSLENWAACKASMAAALVLQRWLRGGDGERAGGGEGEGGWC
jgi:hypothetical protein